MGNEDITKYSGLQPKPWDMFYEINLGPKVERWYALVDDIRTCILKQSVSSKLKI